MWHLQLSYLLVKSKEENKEIFVSYNFKLFYIIQYKSIFHLRS